MTDQIRQLRSLCALYWNPIGVPMANVSTSEELGYPPLPENEYDGYLSRLAELVGGGVSREDMIAFLAKCEAEYMGLSNPAGDKARFVDTVIALHGKT